MKIELGPNEEKTVSTDGRYIFLKSTDAELRLTAQLEGGKETQLLLRKAQEQAEFAYELQAVAFRNLSASPCVVEFETGYARFIPAVQGGAVTFTGQTVPMEVTLDNSGGTQEVSIQGSVSADIDDPVEVRTHMDHPLDVKLKAGGVASFSTETAAAPGIVGGSNSATPRRVIFKADASNTGVYTIGAGAGGGLPGTGYPLAAGETLEMEFTGQVSYYADTASDVLRVVSVPVGLYSA